MTSVVSAGGPNGLPRPCKAPACLGSGTFASPKTWHRITLGLLNRSLTYVIDDNKAEQVELPSGVAVGGGFAGIASSYAEVEFDNFTVAATSPTVPPSRCVTKPAAGQALVAVGCGDPGAAAGSQWQVHGTDGEAGSISLRSDTSLCLATRKPPSKEAEDTGSNSLWDAKIHDAAIAISRDGEWAAWSNAAPGAPGCDAIALAKGGSDVHWMRVEQGKGSDLTGPVFADIGWCAPDIVLSGATWMGWQKGKAWVFRAFNGLFKAADGNKDQGKCLKPPCEGFGYGANITAIKHSNTSLEFLRDGVSVGVAALDAADAVPANAVPCAGGCAGVVLGTGMEAPPVSPPPPPASAAHRARLGEVRGG